VLNPQAKFGWGGATLSLGVGDGYVCVGKRVDVAMVGKTGYRIGSGPHGNPPPQLFPLPILDPPPGVGVGVNVGVGVGVCAAALMALKMMAIIKNLRICNLRICTRLYDVDADCFDDPNHQKNRHGTYHDRDEQGSAARKYRTIQ
jgi:hypothetical protein